MARALVVASHGDLRAQLREFLRAGGWPQVEVAATFAAAQNVVQTAPVALIVSELQGSDGTAVELLESVRAYPDERAGIPMILLAREARMPQVATTDELEVDAILAQPITGKLLQERAAWAYASYRALLPLWQAWFDPEPEYIAALWPRIAESQPRFQAAAARLAGRLLQRSGAYALAATHYETVLSHKATPWATLGKIRCAIAANQYETAQRDLEIVLTAHPDYLAAWAEAARLAELTGSHDALCTAYRHLLETPFLSRRHFHAALPTLLACGAHDIVRQAVERWLRHHPHLTPEDRLFLVLAYQETGRTEQAQRLAQQLLHEAKTPTGKALAHFAQFLLAYRLGAPAEALDSLRLALHFSEQEVLPSDPPEWLVRLLLAAVAIEPVRPQATDLFYRLRTLVTEHTTLQRLEALLTQAGATNLWQKAQSDIAEKAKTWVWQAIGRSHERDWLGATAVLTQAAQQLPGAAAIHFHLALAWLRAAHHGAIAPEAGRTAAQKAVRRLRRLAPFYQGVARIEAILAGNAPLP